MGRFQQLYPLLVHLFGPLTWVIRGTGGQGGRDTGRRAWGPKELIKPGRELEGMARGGGQLGEGSYRQEMGTRERMRPNRSDTYESTWFSNDRMTG